MAGRGRVLAERQLGFTEVPIIVANGWTPEKKRSYMLTDNRLLPANQTAAFFHGHIAYDDAYNGSADSLEEGEKQAGSKENKDAAGTPGAS